MVRLRGWERRFIEGMEFELARPFDWGHSNCGHLMAVAIRACHGEHPILDHLLNLDSQERVEEHLEVNGGLEGILQDHFETIPQSFAQQADVGIFTGVGNIEVGCVIADGVAIAKMPKYNGNGFRLPVSKLSKVYRV